MKDSEDELPPEREVKVNPFLFVALANLFFNPVKSNCAQSSARANITRINECADLPSPDKGKSGDS